MDGHHGRNREAHGVRPSFFLAVGSQGWPWFGYSDAPSIENSEYRVLEILKNHLTAAVFRFSVGSGPAIMFLLRDNCTSFYLLSNF